MNYTLPRGYLSASSLGMLLNCPKQFEFRYINGIILPPNAALATGSVVHKTFEAYYRDAMKGGKRLTPQQVRELAGDTATDYLSAGEVKLNAVENDALHRDATELSGLYVEKIGQYIEPLAVEEEVRFRMSCGVDILAYIDLRRKTDKGEGICDYKITSKKWTPDKLKNSLQFNLYSVITGIGDIQIHNMVKNASTVSKPRITLAQVDSSATDTITRDYSPALRVLEHRFDGSDASHLENMVEAAARLITSGVFMPCALDSWCCSPQWCGYWKLCRGKNQ